MKKELMQGNFLIIPVSKESSKLAYTFCTQKLSELEAERKAIIDVNRFLDFLFLGVYLGQGCQSFSITFLKIDCVNIAKLIEAKQKLPFFGNFHFSTSYNLNDKTLVGVTQAFNKLSHKINDKMWVSLHFWRSGLSQKDEYVRFDQIWKAFEISYRVSVRKRHVDYSGSTSWVKKGLSPKGMKEICDTFSKSTGDEIGINAKVMGCSSPFQCLITQNYASNLRATNYSQNLENALNNNDYETALSNALMCLAKLRNRVFHANIFSDTERPIVFVGSSILSDILYTSFQQCLV